MFKTGVQVSASPPRRSTALRQQFAIANGTTDSGLLLFPKNLLRCKIFSGALIILGVLGACFTRKSTKKSTSFLSIFLIDTIKRLYPFWIKPLCLMINYLDFFVTTYFNTNNEPNIITIDKGNIMYHTGTKPAIIKHINDTIATKIA